MIGIALAVVFFLVAGVLCIVLRKDVAHGISMTLGGSTVPGCAVAVGLFFLTLAAATVVLYQTGAFGPN